MHVGHHRNHAQGNRQIRRRRAGLHLHGSLGFRRDFFGRLENCSGNVDFRIQHRHRDRQRGKIAVAAGRVDFGVYVCAEVNGSGMSCFLFRVFLSFLPGISMSFFIIYIGAVAAGFDAAFHIDRRAANLDVDHIQGIADIGVQRIQRVDQRIHHVAALIDRRLHVHVAACVNLRVFADVDLHRVVYIEEIGLHGLIGAFDLSKLAFGFVVRCNGARAGSSLQVVHHHEAENIDFFTAKDQVHSFSQNIVDGNLSVFAFDDQLIQHAALGRLQNKRINIFQRIFQNEIGEHFVRFEDDNPTSVIFDTGHLIRIDLDFGLIFQLIADPAIQNASQIHTNSVVLRIDERKFIVFGLDGRNGSVVRQFAGEVHVSAVFVGNIHLFISVGKTDIHVHLVVARSGVHRDRRRCRVRFTGSQVFTRAQGHRIRALAGVHRNVSGAFARLNVHRIICRGADDGQGSVLDFNVLRHLLIDARKKQIDAFNQDIAVHAHGVVRGRLVISVVILGCVGRNNVQYKILIRCEI